MSTAPMDAGQQTSSNYPTISDSSVGDLDRKTVLCLDSVRTKMLVEDADDDGPDEIARCLGGCVSARVLIAIAHHARSLGLPIAGESARAALHANNARGMRYWEQRIAADAHDVIASIRPGALFRAAGMS